jgi:dihydroneopterin aldolase
MMRLELRDLSLQVFLGCTPEEQKIAQEIRASIFLEFPKPVGACATDQLQDTVCYEEISIAFRSVANSKPFQTIEHLCFLISEAVRPQIPKGAKARVRVHKVNPPIDGLLGGSACELEVG